MEIKFQHHQWCVFYDDRTGDVVHIHEYLAKGPEKAVTRDRLIEQARRATGDKLAAEGIRILHPPQGMRPEPGARYAVNLREQKLLNADEATMRIRQPLRGRLDRTRADLRRNASS